MFNKLQWRDHPVDFGSGRRGVYTFANGWEVSVVGGARGLYGNGRTSFEVAIFRPNGEFYKDVCRQYIGWQSRQQVSAIMRRVAKYNAE